MASETGSSGALAPDGAERRLAGSDLHERPGPAAAHKAPPNHFQRGAAAGARGALCTESVSRRGHTRALGGPHPPAGGARGGGCLPRSPEANSDPTLLFQRPTFQAGGHLSSPRWKETPRISGWGHRTSSCIRFFGVSLKLEGVKSLFL